MQISKGGDGVLVMALDSIFLLGGGHGSLIIGFKSCVL